MPASNETNDNPAAAETSKESKPLYIWNDAPDRLPSFDFLPAPARCDLIIACADDSWAGNPQNPGGGFNAYALHSVNLTQRSPFFSDVLTLAPKGERHTIHVDEKGHLVAYVLSATLQASRAYMMSIHSWQDLSEALELAVKCGLDIGRTALFHAMAAHLFKYKKPNLRSQVPDISSFVVEAVRQGEPAMVIAASLLRSAGSTDGALKIAPVKFSESHFLEISAAGCSRAFNLILELAEDGVLEVQKP